MNITKSFTIQLSFEPFTRTIEIGEQDVHDEVAEVAINEGYGKVLGKKKAANADTESETEGSDTGSNGTKPDADATAASKAKSPVIPGFN